MIRASEEHLTAIRNHGSETFPNECCGVLLGDVDGADKTVLEVRRLANVFEPSAEFEATGDPDAVNGASEVGQERRYFVSPDEMFALMQEERRTKRKVLGFYHSHPNHPARPSVYDREWASPWYTYIIVSIMSGHARELTAWQLNADRQAFTAETLLTE